MPDALALSRIGLYGGEIPLLKFRAMCIGASQMTASFNDSQRAERERNRKLRDEPRVTQAGHILRRTGLDELRGGQAESRQDDSGHDERKE